MIGERRDWIWIDEVEVVDPDNDGLIIDGKNQGDNELKTHRMNDLLEGRNEWENGVSDP